MKVNTYRLCMQNNFIRIRENNLLKTQKAMSTLKEKYLSAINLIKDEFNLKELSNDTITEYKNYGDQLTKGTKEEKKQAAFVSEFLDIYENSFKDEK